jgi:hypothetical protein
MSIPPVGRDAEAVELRCGRACQDPDPTITASGLGGEGIERTAPAQFSDLAAELENHYARSLNINSKTISVHIPTADGNTPTHKPTKVPVYKPVSSEYCQPPRFPSLVTSKALPSTVGLASCLQVLEDTLEDLQRPYPLGLTPKSLITRIAAL